MPSARERRTLRRSWDLVTKMFLPTRGRDVHGSRTYIAHLDRIPGSGAHVAATRTDEGDVSVVQTNRSSLPEGGLVPEDAADLLETGGEVAFEAEAARLVVAGAAQLVGQVLLLGDAELRVVRVLVALAVPESLRARVVRVAQVLRDAPDAPRAHIRDRRVERLVRPVRLRRRREVDDRLGE